MKTMVLEPLAREYRGEDIVRRCLIRRLDDNHRFCQSCAISPVDQKSHAESL